MSLQTIFSCIVLMYCNLCIGTNTFISSVSEEDVLVAEVVLYLLQIQYPTCFLSVDTDLTDMNPILNIVQHQQRLYHPVLIGQTKPEFHVKYTEFPTIWKEDQLYSFRTMPSELFTRTWHGGKCSLNFILAQSSDNIHRLILHAVTTFRFRNLIDPTYIHVRSKTDPETILLKNPGNGIAYKVMSQYEPGSKQLVLNNVCYYCHSTMHEISAPIHYPPITNLHKNIFSIQPDNLQGLNVTVAFIEEIDMRVAREKAKRSLSLLTHEELSMIEYEMRYNVTIKVVTPEITIEEFYPNGSYAGFTAPLVYGGADLAAVKYFSENTYAALAFTDPSYYFHYSFVTRNPTENVKYYVALQPYTRKAWAAIFFTIIISAAVIHMFLKVEVKLNRSNQPSSLLKIITTLLREFAEQPVSPAGFASVQAFYTYILILSFVVICGYKSKIVSFIAQPELEDLPEYFDELHSSRMKVGATFLMKLGMEMLTEKSERNVLKELLKEIEISTDFRHCFERATNEDFACILVDFFYRKERPMFVDGSGNCKLRWAPEKALNMYIGPAAPRDLIAFDRGKKMMARDTEAGLNEYREQFVNLMTFYRHYSQFRKMSLDKVLQPPGVKAFTIRQLWPVMFFWGLGLVASCLMFIMEKCYSKFNKRKKFVYSYLK